MEDEDVERVISEYTSRRAQAPAGNPLGFLNAVRFYGNAAAMTSGKKKS
jgi:hypothetical protein